MKYNEGRLNDSTTHVASVAMTSRGRGVDELHAPVAVQPPRGCPPPVVPSRRQTKRAVCCLSEAIRLERPRRGERLELPVGSDIAPGRRRRDRCRSWWRWWPRAGWAHFMRPANEQTMPYHVRRGVNVRRVWCSHLLVALVRGWIRLAKCHAGVPRARLWLARAAWYRYGGWGRGL
jgi:hypothetical protein